MEKFKFSNWAKGLPSGVADIFVDSGFDSWHALVNATTTDIADLKLKPGHRVATLALLQELQSTTEGPIWKHAETAAKMTEATSSPVTAQQFSTTTPMTAQQFPATLTNISHSLDEVLRLSSGASEAPLGGRVDLDPCVFLNTRSGETALQIPDFVSFRDNAEHEDIELKEGVVIRLAKGKPKLDSISPAQFIAANSRILARLIESGRLAGQGILDYLAYTAKVGEMATRYTWSSVLTYDHQYRQSQAAYGFRWGSDSQHLALVALKERAGDGQKHDGQQRSSRPPRPSAPKLVGPSGKELCKQWNRGHCAFAPRCHFEHCCSICLQPSHPASSHTTPTGGASNSV